MKTVAVIQRSLAFIYTVINKNHCDSVSKYIHTLIEVACHWITSQHDVIYSIMRHIEKHDSV